MRFAICRKFHLNGNDCSYYFAQAVCYVLFEWMVERFVRNEAGDGSSGKSRRLITAW
jgi:hypothetical protein